MNFCETDPEHITGCQRPVAREPLTPEQRSISALEIAGDPARLGGENLGVESAGPLVMENDPVAGGPPERHPLSDYERENAAPQDGVSDAEVAGGNRAGH